MQPQMSPIDSSDSLFHNGNPLTGVKGTIATAEWLNAVQASTRDIQAELIAILTAAALAPDDTAGQLLAAIRKLTMSRTNPGADLVTDGSVSTFLQNLGLGASAFGLRNCAIFSTAGVTTWSVPELLQNGRKAKVTVIGAGASGGRAAGGGGGGGGGIAQKIVDLTGILTVTITVGAGGTAPAAGTSQIGGVDGGSSSFGSYCSATGGTSGGTPSAGWGGAGVGGDTNSSLGPGSPGNNYNSTSYNSGSGGGPGGAGVSSGTQNNGNNARGPGGGGSGAAYANSTTTSCRAGSGADGLVLIEW